MRVEIIKNFLSQEEIDLLNKWTILGVRNKWLDFGITSNYQKIETRLTNRFYGSLFTYPEKVLEISDKVRDVVGVANYPLIEGHGKNGIVVSYTMPRGDVYKHKDPKSKEGLSTLRCNILTQKAEQGGVLFVEGKQINIEVGDLHCYLVSDHEHWATEVKGNTPRIMWMFGAHVPSDDWNNKKIKVNDGLS